MNDNLKADVVNSLTADLLSRTYNFKIPEYDNHNVECIDKACAKDKKPSMSVKLSPFFYCCHRCGNQGDALSLIGYYENLDCKSDFRKILKRGAEIAGIKVEEEVGTTKKVKTKIAYEDFIERNKTTDEKLISKVKSDYYESNKINLEDFSEVTYIKDKGEGEFAFPIRNHKGVIMGYQRGVKKHLVESSKPRFFFDPEEVDFSKKLYLVEGLSDYLTMLSSGIKNVVALVSATVPIADVTKLLERLSSQVKCNVCLDYDGVNKNGQPRDHKTGFAGAKKATTIKKRFPSKCILFFVSIKEKKDLNDIYVESGPGAIVEFFGQRQSVNLNELASIITGGDCLDAASIADFILTEMRVTVCGGEYWMCDSDNVWRIVDGKIIENKIMNTMQCDLGLSHNKKIIKEISYYIKIKTISDAMNLRSSIGQSSHHYQKYKNYIFLKNGKYNLKNNQLEPYNCDDYITSTLKISTKERKTECPNWDKFIDSVFNGDEDKNEKIRLVRQMMGYILYPHFPFHKLFILLGRGGNGKGVLSTIMTSIVGEGNHTNMEVEQLESDDYAMYNLLGKYLNFGTEGKRGFPVDGSIIKKLTGGDPVTARKIYGSPFEYVPFAKQIFSMNDEPSVKGSAENITRRLVMIPFNNTFDDGLTKKGDANLGVKLEKEKEAIFWWAVDGLVDLLGNDGFAIPESVEKRTTEFINSNDSVLNFWEKEAKIEASTYLRNELSISKMYRDFRNYCIDKEGSTSRFVPKRQSFISKFVDTLGDDNCKIKYNSDNEECFIVNRDLLMKKDDDDGFVWNKKQPGFDN